MPVAVGVPLIVATLLAQLAVRPAGKPLKVAPVAPVVAYVIVAIGELMQIDCASVPTADVRLTVLVGLIVSTPLTLVVPFQNPPPPPE